MNIKRRIMVLLVLGGACPACAVEGEADVGEATYAAMGFNGLGDNALTFNAFTYNGIDLANGLAANGLNLGNGLGAVDLGDPLAHQFVEYLVSCVLPEGDAVEVGGESFAGGLGLAPEWADGACDEDCQRWASACLLARVNARGEHVQLSMRGPHPALHPSSGELQAFAREEGTYFGNIFRPTQARWATSARDDLTLPRSCGESVGPDGPVGPDGGCYVQVTGRSADVCESNSRAEGRRHCQDGDGVAWQQGITVYLR